MQAAAALSVILPGLLSAAHNFPSSPDLPEHWRAAARHLAVADREMRKKQQDGMHSRNLGHCECRVAELRLDDGGVEISGNSRGTWKLTAIRDNFWCGPETLPNL